MRLRNWQPLLRRVSERRRYDYWTLVLSPIWIDLAYPSVTQRRLPSTTTPESTSTDPRVPTSLQDAARRLPRTIPWTFRDRGLVGVTASTRGVSDGSTIHASGKAKEMRDSAAPNISATEKYAPSGRYRGGARHDQDRQAYA